MQKQHKYIMYFHTHIETFIDARAFTGLKMYSKWLRNLRSSQLCFKVYTKILLPQAMLLYNDAHIGGFILIYVYKRSRSKPSCFCQVFLFCINASSYRLCIYVHSQTTELACMYIYT